MKTIGWILVFAGVVNLLCAKLLPGFSFFIVGILMLSFHKDQNKEEFKSDKSINNDIRPDINEYLTDYILEIKSVEKILDTNFSYWDLNDVIETVESFKRWASNLNCTLLEIKEVFMTSYLGNFKDECLDIAIRHFRSKESEEASFFHIKSKNTCAHYMVLWLKEYQDSQKRNEDKNTITNERMQVRNKMAASELVKRHNAELKFYYFPNNNERMYFECGPIKGYVSPAVVKRIDSVQIEDLQYAECAKKNTEVWVPCIMFHNKSPHAPGTLFKKSMGADILNIPNEQYKTDLNNEDQPF